jgi:hypothetical protein
MDSKDCQSEAGHADWWEPGWYVNRRDCWGYVPHYITWGRLIAELPENAPRYVVLSYEMVSHTLSWDGVWEADDRNTPMDGSQTRSYWSIGTFLPSFVSQTLTIRAPSSSPTDLMTLHASMLSNFQQVVEVSKVRKLIQWVKEELTNRYWRSEMGRRDWLQRLSTIGCYSISCISCHA